MTKNPDLESAYALGSPDEHRRPYADWANSYDETFKQATDYRLHKIVTNTHADADRHGPVLDVGAGTGLVGEVLAARGVAPVDATDLSPEMLAVAGEKGVYRDLIEADLFKGLPMPDATYRGITCAGTFTHGHVGPDVLPELLCVAAPGALVTLSINTQHFRAAHFEQSLTGFYGLIAELKLPEVQIYGSGRSGLHATDTAYIVSFRKI